MFVGEVFHDSIPQYLTFNEAQSYCRAAGAELATTAQLYLAWSEGLDHCSPGWLSDGSVRYPIITPRERCGGPQPGVKTLYRFSNQTGFPEASSLHDVYCFKGENAVPLKLKLLVWFTPFKSYTKFFCLPSAESSNASTDSPLDYVSTEPEGTEHSVVILMEKDQEIELNQPAEQVEREAQSLLESWPYFSEPFTEEHPVDTHTTVVSDTTESPLDTTSALLEPSDETLSPTEMSYNSQHPTAPMSSTIAETYNSTQNTSFLPTVYNETDSHQNSSLTIHQSESPTFEPQTQNQTEPDANSEVNTEPSGNPSEIKEIQETNMNFSKSEHNYNESDRNHTQEDSFLEATIFPFDQAELEEAGAEDAEQMLPTAETSKEDETLPTQLSQNSESTAEVWAHMDGSGDISQGTCISCKSSNITILKEWFSGQELCSLSQVTVILLRSVTSLLLI